MPINGLITPSRVLRPGPAPSPSSGCRCCVCYIGESSLMIDRGSGQAFDLASDGPDKCGQFTRDSDHGLLAALAACAQGFVALIQA
jgi:hypothetical protein